MVFALRGAIQVGANTAEEIVRAASRLVREICVKNSLSEDNVVSILFSVTDDLTAANPAAGLRRDGFSLTPLFCVQEARMEGKMPRIIRVLLTAQTEESFTRGKASKKKAAHVYLDGAEALRPDLKGEWE
jgi:chorismate mutase